MGRVNVHNLNKTIMRIAKQKVPFVVKGQHYEKVLGIGMGKPFTLVVYAKTAKQARHKINKQREGIVTAVMPF